LTVANPTNLGYNYYEKLWALDYSVLVTGNKEEAV
jgi:hypothetical protein